jgi:hypothetical protein
MVVVEATPTGDDRLLVTELGRRGCPPPLDEECVGPPPEL